MSTLHFRASAGRDGFLRLEVPVPEGNYDVTVIPLTPRVGATPIQDREGDYVPTAELLKEDVFRTATERGWPPGFFEQTMGSIDDERFIRHPQGDYPPPVSFE